MSNRLIIFVLFLTLPLFKGGNILFYKSSKRPDPKWILVLVQILCRTHDQRRWSQYLSNFTIRFAKWISKSLMWVDTAGDNFFFSNFFRKFKNANSLYRVFVGFPTYIITRPKIVYFLNESRKHRAIFMCGRPCLPVSACLPVSQIFLQMQPPPVWRMTWLFVQLIHK